MPQDKAAAVRWYRAAGDQGVTSALFNLGMMAWRGEGMEKSAEESFRFHRRAAEAGHAKSQLVLGRMLLNGQGVPKDRAEAIRWLRASAGQGTELARQELEKLGEPVPPVRPAPTGDVAAGYQRGMPSTSRPVAAIQLPATRTAICAQKGRASRANAMP